MKIAILAIAAALAACTQAASPAATQEWVIKYCADHGLVAVSTSRGATYTSGEGTNAVTMGIVRPTAYAIVATNCEPAAVSYGITNGMRFVYHRPYAVFVNQPASRYVLIDIDAETRKRTYVCNSWTSALHGKTLWFEDSATNRVFSVYGTRILDAEAHSLTNGFNGGGL